MVNALECLFASLAENNLHSFRCEESLQKRQLLQLTRFKLGFRIMYNIPSEVLWHDSGLVNRQKPIETISLMTDHDCGSNIYTQYFVDLTLFDRLRSLTWGG